MMASDDDLQLLDAHLDDALSPIDAEHLRVRLAAEPELAAALEQLRAERAVRSDVWHAMEPTDAEAAAIAAGAMRRSRTEDVRRRLTRALGAVAAAAACFAAGWFARPVETPPVPSPAKAIAKATTTAPAPGTFQVALTDAAGNVLAVQTFTQLDEARRFAADLTAWQAEQQQARQGGQMLLVADEF